MNITVEEAKNEKIFVIENGEIVETNLFDFVMISAEMTTSPRGAENKLHVREVETEERTEYQVWTWGFRGQYPKLIETFTSLEEAENDIFSRTMKYDFNSDDQRLTLYFYDFDEAFAYLAECLGYSAEVYRSIKKHEVIVAEGRKNKVIEQRENEDKRVNSLALIYSNMIEKIEGESYKETCARLSSAIGEKIEGRVFHKAVKIVRS